MNQTSAIALLHYNKKRLTTRCLDSILEAGVEPWRIHCLDNGSLPEVSSDLTRQYPDLHHEILPENKGFSGGFNAALKTVFNKGFDQCIFLTNDTVFHPNSDQALVKSLQNHSAGIAAPNIYYLSNPDKIDSTGAFFDPETASLGHYHTDDLPLVLQPENDYIPGTALAMTRDAFFELDGADENYHTYWEDVDLCFRAARAGITMVRSPDARILHGVGQTCHKKPFYTTYLFQRNRLTFCRKFFSGEQLARIEKIITEQWNRMKQEKTQRGDTRRLKYINDLLGIL